jgi:hypothetical protein
MPQVTAPMTTPASAGPTTRLTSALTRSSETACGTDPRGTSSVRKAIRAGLNSAKPTAWSTLAPSSIQ